MYDNLAQVLRKSRKLLLAACKEIDLDPKLVDPELIPLNCCDWCGFWDSKRAVAEDPDGTKYCKTCISLEYMK